MKIKSYHLYHITNISYKSCPATTLTCFSFFFRTSSHSFTILPHRIHESSSRWLRLLEADELDTREDPLFLLDPFTDRRDLLSVSRSLQRKHEKKFLSQYHTTNSLFTSQFFKLLKNISRGSAVQFFHPY